MLSRFSISLIFFSAFAFAINSCNTENLVATKEQVDNVQKKYSDLNSTRKQDLNTTKLMPTQEQLDNAKKYQDLNKFDDSKLEQYKNIANPDMAKLSELFKQQRIENYAAMLRGEQKSSAVIFYLMSKTVPAQTVKNVFRDAKELSDKYTFFAVLRGLDSKGIDQMRTYKELEGITVKINPIVFDEADVHTVPAFVYAECNITTPIMRAKECEYKKVVYGDVSLEFAMELMGLAE